MGPPWGYGKSISKVAGRKAALAGRGQLPPELAEEPQSFPVFNPKAHACVSLPQEVKANRMTELEAGLKQEQTQPRRMLLTALSTGQAHASHSQPCTLTRALLHELPLGKGATGCEDQILHQVLSATGLTASDKAVFKAELQHSYLTAAHNRDASKQNKLTFGGQLLSVEQLSHSHSTHPPPPESSVPCRCTRPSKKQQRCTSSSSASHSYHSSFWRASGC